mmetsp:Transcript_97128/g.251268  ORF Transcript_97128/g.251268 Transcript_97128/m.251268 type:complete len:350 (+) Transcript_97128:640-1689(+)
MLAHGVTAAQKAHADRRGPVRFDELLEGRQDDVCDGALVEDLKNAAEAHQDLHLHFHNARHQQQLQHPRKDLVFDLAVLELLVQIRHLLKDLVQNYRLLQLQAAQQEGQQRRLSFRRRGQTDKKIQLLEEERHNLNGNLLGAVQRLYGWPHFCLEVRTVRHTLPLEHLDDDGDHDCVEAWKEQRATESRQDPLTEDPLRAEGRLHIIKKLGEALQEGNALRLSLLVELLKESDRTDVHIHEELGVDERRNRQPIRRVRAEDLHKNRVQVGRNAALAEYVDRVASGCGAQQGLALVRHQLVREQSQGKYVRLEATLARHVAHLWRGIPRRWFVAQLSGLLLAREGKGAVH